MISIITIPLFIFFDNKQLTEKELIEIDNLILKKNSYKDAGGGKWGTPSLKFEFTNTERVFLLTYEEYQCVTNKIILENFKKGDTVSIKISKSDRDNFFKTNWFSKSSKIYGLSKHSKNYLSLDCRNKISNRWTTAAVVASTATAILSLIFAIVLSKPKNKYEAIGMLPFDPILVVLIVWILICIMLR